MEKADIHDGKLTGSLDNVRVCGPRLGEGRPLRPFPTGLTLSLASHGIPAHDRNGGKRRDPPPPRAPRGTAFSL